MIIYLTFNDGPSGIFSSQVTDVVKFIRSELKADIRLVSFISIRNFRVNKKKIQSELEDAIVIPMFPGFKRWRHNLFALKLIYLFLKPTAIIGRSVLACQLALRSGIKKVAYDGRGAIAAEWREYNVVTDKELSTEIKELERTAVLTSNARLAVSHQLLLYWKTEFKYKGSDHVVIPCTLNSVFEQLNLEPTEIQKARTKLGISPGDIVLAYSGSVAGWQSFELLYDFIKPLLSGPAEPASHKLLLLCDRDKNVIRFEKEFPGKIICIKIPVTEVPHVLVAADYGLLIREESVTNRVASPVKFAEYLACGLKVIISDNLGDYSNLATQEDLGVLAGVNNYFPQIDIYTKLRLRDKALKAFTKQSFATEYLHLINLLK